MKRRAQNRRCPRGTQIQTILFDKRHFTKDQARKWILNYGEAAGKADDKGNFFRYRQREKKDFEPGSFRTISFAPDVKAVIGCPKPAKNPNLYFLGYADAVKLTKECKKSIPDFGYSPEQKAIYRLQDFKATKSDLDLLAPLAKRARVKLPTPGDNPRRARRKNHGCTKAPAPLAYNPGRARRGPTGSTARPKRRNPPEAQHRPEIHVDIYSHNARRRKENAALAIPKTVVILGAALDMEIERPNGKRLIYSWRSPWAEYSRRTKGIEALITTNTLGNELYILPFKAKRVGPHRMKQFIERHRDAPEGAKLYKKWSDFPAKLALIMVAPNAKLHRAGKVISLSYVSDKWTGRDKAYIHTFRQAPELYSCRQRKIHTLFSKTIKVTPDGIKG
jgi:hypothetical protein